MVEQMTHLWIQPILAQTTDLPPLRHTFWKCLVCKVIPMVKAAYKMDLVTTLGCKLCIESFFPLKSAFYAQLVFFFDNHYILSLSL